MPNIWDHETLAVEDILIINASDVIFFMKFVYSLSKGSPFAWTTSWNQISGTGSPYLDHHG